MSENKYPQVQHAHLAERLPTVPEGTHVREWTLRDDNRQHVHGTVHSSESPLHLRLYWRADAQSPVREVGLFRLHLGALLGGGYIRTERSEGGGDELRLRFHRRPDGTINIQVRGDTPALAIGSIG